MNFIETFKNIVKKNTDKNDLTTLDKIKIFESPVFDRAQLSNEINKLFDSYKIEKTIYINKTFFSELNIDNILDKFDHYTLYGKFVFKNMAESPTDDITLLKKRQNNIKKLLKNSENFDEIKDNLIALKDLENDILWFWREETEDTKSLYDLIYFNLPYFGDYVNENALILNITNIYKIFISPSITIFIPMVFFAISYLLLYIFNIRLPINLFTNSIFNILKIYFKLFIFNGTNYKIKFASLIIIGIYLFVYIQSAYNLIKIAYETNKIINILHKKLINVAKLIRRIKEISEATEKLQLFTKSSIENLSYFDNLLNDNTFSGSPGLFSNKGKILSTYKKFIKNKDLLIELLFFLGEVDTYITLADTFISYNEKNNKYSFPEYKSDNKPILKIDKVWHPILQKPILNDIIIEKNLLITGPNKSGKSTFIKSLAINILLSQTFGISASSNMILTPFQIMDSYLNIVDNIGYESLFEAEILRAKKYLNLIKEKDKKSFIVMDEIFTSTNFVEGYSSAYAIIKKLCEYDNNLSIITTHFTGLKNLEKDTDNKIKNYKFIIKKDKNNKLIYPYKLLEGFSKQYIALELLKNNKFDGEIIKNAIKIKNKICGELEKIY